MTGRLTGKVALISGTGGGQGAAAAKLFCEEGAVVIGCDIDADAAAETAARITAEGGRMLSMAADLADEQQARSWIAFAAESCGGFDILYNNAGACRFGAVCEMSAQDWTFTLRNELDLVFFSTKHAVPYLKQRGGGSIINVSSVAGLTGSTFNDSLFQFAHSTTKGGVIAMTRTLAAELGRDNIRVNVISPGIIETPALTTLPKEHVQPVIDAFLERAVIKRMGRAEDIAYCAIYLASDESTYVTGQNFCVDGGVTVS